MSLAALALLASVAGEPVDLGAVFAFTDPAECRAGPALEAIFSQMFGVDQQAFAATRGGPIPVAGFAAPVEPGFERTATDGVSRVEATLDLPGRWHGLPVTGLTSNFAENADESVRIIRFAGSPEEVRAALNRAGFALPPPGERRQYDLDGELPSYIGVESAPGGANLVCWGG